MGCGSSSLKGEKQEDIAEQPIKQVKTNFSAVDYDSAAKGRRDTVYAPDETKRVKSDALSPLADKNDPLHTASIDSTAVNSSQPRTVGEDKISFDSKIPDTSNPGTQTKLHEDDGRAPYDDVTASPATPFQTRNIDEHLPPAPAPASKDITEHIERSSKEITDPVDKSNNQPSTVH